MLGRIRSLSPHLSATTSRWALRAVTFVLIAVAAVILVAVPGLRSAPVFTDVDTSPYKEAIIDLANREIISGFGDGRFGPGESVRRQQFAKMIVLTAGYPCSTQDISPFTDVETTPGTDLYPDHYVAVAATRGITLGTAPGLFSPYAFVSRYQVVSMVVRAADDLQPGLLQTPPASWVDPSGWGDDATHGLNARRAEYGGLLAGIPVASLSPWGAMTRGEVAQVLHNLLVALGIPSPTTTGTSSTTSTTTNGSTTSSSSTSSTSSSSSTTSTTDD